MAKFANRFRELRKSRNLSQQKLADRLGISKSSVNMYERGEREPGLEMLEAIADFFNVDMNYLMGTDDSIESIKAKEYKNKIDVELSALIAKLIKSNDDQTKRFIINFLTLSPQEREMFKKLFPDIQEKENKYE